MKAYLDIQENKNDFPISRTGPYFGRAPFLDEASMPSGSSYPPWGIKKDTKGRIMTSSQDESKAKKERESNIFERDTNAPVELYDDKSTQKQ